jgi:hypothetical protein
MSAPVLGAQASVLLVEDDPDIRHERWSGLPVVVMTAAGDRIMGVDLETLNVPVLRKWISRVSWG